MTHTILTKDVTGNMYSQALAECEQHLASRAFVSAPTRDKVAKQGLTLTPFSGNVEALPIYRSISRERSYSGSTYTTTWATAMPIHEIHIEVNTSSALWRAMSDPEETIRRILENCGYRGPELARCRQLSTHFAPDSITHVVEFVVPHPRVTGQVVCVRWVLSSPRSQFVVPAWTEASFGALKEIVRRTLVPAGVNMHADGTADLLISCNETEFLPSSAPTGLTRAEFLDLMHGRMGLGDLYISSRDIGQQCREICLCQGFTPEAFHITPEGYCGPENFEGDPVLKLLVMTELWGRNSGYYPISRRNGTYGYGTEKKLSARLSALGSGGHRAVSTQLARKKIGGHVETWGRVTQRLFPELSKGEVIMTCDKVLGQVGRLPPDFQLQVFGGSPDKARVLLEPFVVKDVEAEEETAA